MAQLSAIQRAKRAMLARLADQPAVPAKKPQLGIRDVIAVAVREPASGKAYVLLSISTDAGITGVGEMSVSSDPLPAVRQAAQVRRELLGQDALAAEVVRHLLLLADKEWRRFVPAVNMALLDILAQIAKAPLYEVLGGPTRTKARAMANLRDLPTTGRLELIQRLHKDGFRAFAVPLNEKPGPTLPRRTRESLDALRKVLGNQVDFALDGRGRLSPPVAVAVAREIERFHVLFFDEPCSQDSPAVLRKLSEETAVPLGVGHHPVDESAFQDWLSADAVDILRPDMSRLGITAIRKLAALAETYYVAVAPVNRAGPLTTVAALHLAASIPNFFIQEVPIPRDDRDRQMRRDLLTTPVEVPTDGFFALPPAPTRPGLGVRLNADALDKYRVKE